MSSLIQTKERLNSTRSTQKVIKAMELVASSKIKKAKEKAINNEAYFNNLSQMMQSVFSYEDMQELLDLTNNEDNTLIIGITSDMGLCGAYNNNVIKKTLELIEKYPHSEKIMIGNKGINKFNYDHIELFDQVMDFSRQEDFSVAKHVTKIILDLYQEKKINKVLVVYTEFVNPILQEVRVLDVFSLEKLEKTGIYNYELIVDGPKEQIFEDLFVQYINSVMYYTILHSIASEYAARRNSMEAANNNSLELIDKLNLELNRIRQDMITQEIAEIIGGAEALNKE